MPPTSVPPAISRATIESGVPLAKSRPATIGPSAAPARPTPITKPVPPARSAAGKDWAMTA